MERLREQYNKEIVPALKEKFGYKNVMQVPRVTKIVVNAGVGKFLKDTRMMESIVADIAKITGQAPIKTKARKSIAGFKVREGQVVGVVVTLRGEKMYSFLDKLINVSLPRVKDFHGVSATGFDGRGNYHLGIKEQLVFPEISTDAIEHTFGLEVSIVASGNRDKVTRELLRLMHFPFKQEK